MRHLLLGLFLLASLGLLGYYTLFMSGTDFFGKTKSMTLVTREADGLRAGDSIQLAGMRVGRVESLGLDPRAPIDQRITVSLILEEDVQLFNDHSIRIADATLLGGHLVRIEPGDPATGEFPWSADEPLQATVQPDVFEALSSLGESFGGDALSGALDSLGSLFSDLNEGGAAGNLNTTLENFASASEDMRLITDSVAAGRGTIGALLNDTSFFDTWRSAGDNLATPLTAARTGDGLLPALLSDSALRTRASGVIDRADSALSGIADLTAPPAPGETSVASVLLRDPAAGEQVKRIVANLDQLTDQLINGDGTLTRLLNEGEVYDIARDILVDLKKASEMLTSGQGTLGLLLSDDSVYVQLELALRTLTRSIEDFREAAPVTAFTQSLFGAL